MNIIDANFLSSVYKIKVGDSVGSAYLMSWNKKYILITAKHCFSTQGDTLQEVWDISKEKPQKLNYDNILFHPDLDVAIIFLNWNHTPNNFPFNYEVDSAQISQEVFAIGFPNGIHMPNLGDNDYVTPIVRKGIIAGVEDNHFIINTHIYPGDSGGIVITKSPITQQWTCLGVIINYLNNSSTRENMGLCSVVNSKSIIEFLDQENQN